MSWTCPRCAQAFAARNQSHSCDRQAVEAHFEGEPKALALYHAVLEVLDGFGEVEPAATRTQVSFRRRIRFAWLWMLHKHKGSGPHDLTLTFDLHRRLQSPRLREVVQTRGDVWTHHLPLDRKEQLDAELAGWLREAWEAAA